MNLMTTYIILARCINMYLDIINDDGYIDHFMNSILNNAKYQRYIKNLYEEANIEYESDSESSLSSVDWSIFGNW